MAEHLTRVLAAPRLWTELGRRHRKQSIRLGARTLRVVGQPDSRNDVWVPDGTWALTVHPHNGNGSHIHIDLDRRFKGKGWIFYPAVALFGRRMFKRNLCKRRSTCSPAEARTARRSSPVSEEPGLEGWHRFIGRWETEGAHPMLPGEAIRGTSTFEWLDGRRFVIWRSNTSTPRSRTQSRSSVSRMGSCPCITVDYRQARTHVAREVEARSVPRARSPGAP
jgi:hypothetical protein